MSYGVVRERDVLRGVIRWLRGRGIWYWRVVDMCHSGMPDVVCVVGGRFVGVECKGSRGEVSGVQREVFEGIRGAGGVVLVVRSVKELEEGMRREGLI